MKTNQIQYFLAIIDHGGIRAAARSLAISQSAVTKALSELEEKCGSQLIVRQTRGGIKLTNTAKRIEPYFRSIQANMNWAKAAIDNTKTGDYGVLRVGVTPLIATTVLDEAYKWFRSRFSHVQLQFTDGLLSNITPALKSSKMDYAIALLMEDWFWDQDQIAVEELFSLPQGFVARENHPIFQSRDPKMTLSHYEWLITIDSFEEADSFISQCIVNQGIEKPLSVMLVDTLICYKLLQSTDCIAVVPKALFQNAPGFVRMRALDLYQSAPCFSLPNLKLVLLRSPAKPVNHAGEFLIHCIISTIKARFNPV
ncbi:LysR family transcriptional regulator [Klebsiella indica]|uniref:LysR family transcriptional regulator n=1 Tax=Klebsiella indica TaxID=2582917 RepID=A0A5R9LPX2_9ENTR|nr:MULTISPECIES: LysR family transcriptional regulator [Klebsiella]TLV23834.1 LysR family transcriptional regulator [Klebsiella indica]